MKSFIPWIGGKSLHANRIVSMFPEKIERYIEPESVWFAAMIH